MSELLTDRMPIAEVFFREVVDPAAVSVVRAQVRTRSGVADGLRLSQILSALGRGRPGSHQCVQWREGGPFGRSE